MGLTANPGVGDTAMEVWPGDSDNWLERIWVDYKSIKPYVIMESTESPKMDMKIDYVSINIASKPFQDVLPVELNIPNCDSKLCGALPSGRFAAIEGHHPLLSNISMLTVWKMALCW